MSVALFQLFDRDNDSLLNREELRNVVEVLFEIQRRNEIPTTPNVVRFVVVYFLFTHLFM